MDLTILVKITGLRVSELIDYDSKAWRKDLVESIFLPHEVATICQIPLSHRLPEDRLMWHYHPKGFYLVRSAYMMEIANVRRTHGSTVGESSGSSTERMDDAFFWKLCIPNKVKHFV